MTELMSMMATARKIIMRVAEIMVLLIAVIVLLHILLGEAAGSYAMMVSGNVAAIIGFVSPETITALILALVILQAFRGRGDVTPKADPAPSAPADRPAPQAAARARPKKAATAPRSKAAK